MNKRQFDYYLVLGDSMSMDLYPAKDLEERNPFVSAIGVGAASLLFRNRDDLWPEFRSQDLATQNQNIGFVDYSFDGAMVEDLLHFEMVLDYTELAKSQVIVTVTAGGNDLLEIEDQPENAQKILALLQDRFVRLMEMLRRAVPSGSILVTTLYDPTDGTGTLPEHQLVKTIPVREFTQFNDFLRTLPTQFDNIVVADVHQAMFGRGESASSEDRWYWNTSRIEPNIRGAHEIRKVWYDALTEQGMIG